MDQELILTKVALPERRAQAPHLLNLPSLGPPRSEGPFPTIGDTVENCRLLATLGRGAFGMAFLAQQETLADRPIVLKVTAENTHEEHLTLARLQHTHIMPLYW